MYLLSSDSKGRMRRKPITPSKRKRGEGSSDSEEEEFDESLLEDEEEEELKEEEEDKDEEVQDEEVQNDMVTEILQFMQDAHIGKGPVTVEALSEENSQEVPGTSSELR